MPLPTISPFRLTCYRSCKCSFTCTCLSKEKSFHLPYIISLNFSSKTEKEKWISRGLFTKDCPKIQSVPGARNKVMLPYQRYFCVQLWAQDSWMLNALASHCFQWNLNIFTGSWPIHKLGLSCVESSRIWCRICRLVFVTTWNTLPFILSCNFIALIPGWKRDGWEAFWAVSRRLTVTLSQKGR